MEQNAILQGRARMYRQIRAFFDQKGVLEVETPVFSQAGNPDPSIQSLSADFKSAHQSTAIIRYAHTSPEFPMKRLLANGSGAIYQICKVFRLGEIGRLHNPEFSMLEWYRPGLSYQALMAEMAELLLLLGIAQHCQYRSYSDLFEQYLGLDIMRASSDQLKDCAAHQGIDVVGLGNDIDDWRHLLMSHVIEPQLKTLGAVFVYDYPSSQAALANIRSGAINIAERFELYIDGIEIANAYQELTDAQAYQCRFNQENSTRVTNGLQKMTLDENLLQAMRDGLPESSGVALGLDRLLMCYLKKGHIEDVLSFGFNEA